MLVAHKARYHDDFRANAEIAASRYDYHHLHFMDRAETEARVGSKRFHCGVHDAGTGHLHPLKLCIGVARAARAGRRTYPRIHPGAIHRLVGGTVSVVTDAGTITAGKALIATNA